MDNQPHAWYVKWTDGFQKLFSQLNPPSRTIIPYSYKETYDQEPRAGDHIDIVVNRRVMYIGKVLSDLKGEYYFVELHSCQPRYIKRVLRHEWNIKEY